MFAVLEEDLHRVRQARDAGETGLLERGETVDFDRLTAGADLGAGVETIESRHHNRRSYCLTLVGAKWMLVGASWMLVGARSVTGVGANWMLAGASGLTVVSASWMLVGANGLDGGRCEVKGSVLSLDHRSMSRPPQTSANSC
jgi:hypothetical protein